MMMMTTMTTTEKKKKKKIISEDKQLQFRGVKLSAFVDHFIKTSPRKSSWH
jgi:hypothetical protein